MIMSDNTFQPLPIDDLLKQLKGSAENTQILVNQTNSTLSVPISSPPIIEEELGNYVIKKASNLIEQSMSVIHEIKDIAMTSNDPETICALADLIKSTNASLETLNKINIQNKKAKSSKEIAIINAEAKKKSERDPTNQTNIMVGTREEVLKLLGEISKKPALDAVVEAEIVSAETAD